MSKTCPKCHAPVEATKIPCQVSATGFMVVVACLCTAIVEIKTKEETRSER